MRAGRAVLVIGVAALAVCILPMLVIRQISHLDQARRTAILDILALEGTILSQSLRPVLAGGGPDALISADMAVGALQHGRVGVELLLRRATAPEREFFVVAVNQGDREGALQITASELLGDLQAACEASRQRALTANGLLAVLTPVRTTEGCWVVLARVDNRSMGLVSIPGIGWAIVAYLIGLGLLVGMPLSLRRGGPLISRDPAPLHIPERDASSVCSNQDFVDLSVLVSEVAQRLAAAHGNRISIAAATAPGLFVRGSRMVLSMAIGRLLGTAVAATQPGGLVSVRLERGGGVVRLIVDEVAASAQVMREAAAGLGGRVRIEADEDLPVRTIVDIPAASGEADATASGLFDKLGGRGVRQSTRHSAG